MRIAVIISVEVVTVDEKKRKKINTTIEINLLKRVKQQALDEEKGVNDIIEEALALYFPHQKSPT